MSPVIDERFLFLVLDKRKHGLLPHEACNMLHRDDGCVTHARGGTKKPVYFVDCFESLSFGLVA